MKLTDVDANFLSKNVSPEKFDWFDHSHEKVTLHGIYYDDIDEEFKRLSRKVATDISDGVLYLHNHTAGGRIKFRTNSNTFAIMGEQEYLYVMQHMPIYGQAGFSIYVDGFYSGTVAPTISDIQNRKNDIFTFDGEKIISPEKFKQNVIHDVEIYFPLYYNVKKVLIGVEKGSVIEKPKDYTYAIPVVFYGSSITQGGCASHPGNDYASMLSRKFDFDFINLGFSGSGKGEPLMADYIASLNMSVFVMDYDHNAPSLQHLKDTHYPMFETIRKAHPYIPIIFMSKPDCDYRVKGAEHRAVVRETYKKAVANGDKNVYYISGLKLFGTDQRDACAVDACHPNDLGFYRMAKALEPVFKKILKGN